jgi:hypothetical protein
LKVAHQKPGRASWSWRGFDLKGSDLVSVKFNDAILVGADLSHALLGGAILTQAQIHSVFSLSGTALAYGYEERCKEIPDKDVSDEKKQAENRDACLAQYGKTG